jgi:hypothetical protein
LTDSRHRPATADPDAVAQRMRGAGLPASTLAARRAALPVAVQDLHCRALTALAETGRPPSRPGLAADADALGVDLAEALTKLARAELLFLTPDGRGVLGGVPFAAAPTAHRVGVRGGPTVWANCAVDALGIGAMLGRDTDVRSVDPVSGEPVTASGRGGQWTWQPAEAVVFVGSSGNGTITDACCPVINFFVSADNAVHYQRRHGLTGEVLSMPEAALAGALVFGGPLAEPTP